MVSLEFSMFGFYPVVIGAILAISHAQFPGENWQGGIQTSNTFQRPLFSTVEQSRLTELIQNPANTISNVQWVSRHSLSAKNPPLPRKTSYRKSYGSLVKRSAEGLQPIKKELSHMSTDLRKLRIKRQAPGFQVWDFHPSSLVRKRLIEAREQRSRNKNVPNTVQRSSNELNRQEFTAQKSGPDPLPTERQVKSIAKDLKLQPADVNIHLPVANYNSITQNNKMPLKTQIESDKNTGKTKIQKIPSKSSTKKKTGAAIQNTRSNIIISKNTNSVRSKTQPGPKYSNRGFRANTSPQTQFDFTAAALIGKETGPKQRNSNDRNQILDNGSGKADGIGNYTASQYLNSNDVLLDIKALSELIDRTTKILLKHKGLTDANPDKHPLNSTSTSDQRSKATTDPRQRNGQILPARASNTFEKNQQRQGQGTKVKSRVKQANPQNQHKEMLVPQPNVRQEAMPLKARRQNSQDQLINAKFTKVQKETPIKDTKQTYLQQNRQLMLHSKMEPTPAPWAQSQNKAGIPATGRKFSGANIPSDRNMQNQNPRTKSEPTFALLEQKQPQQKGQMLSNKNVKTHKQIRQSMPPQEQTHGKFTNLLLNEQKQVSQKATLPSLNLQEFGDALSATTQQRVEHATLQQLADQKAILNDFGTQPHNPKKIRPRQKEQSESITQTQQERTLVPIPKKNKAPQKLNQRRIHRKMSNTQNILPLSNEPTPNQMLNVQRNMPLTQDPLLNEMSNIAHNRPLNQEPVPDQMSNTAHNRPLYQEPVPGQVSNTAHSRRLTKKPLPGQMSSTIYDLPIYQEPVPGQMPNAVYDMLLAQEPVPGQMSNTVYDLPLTQKPVPGQMSNTAYDLPLTQEPVPGQMPNTVYDISLAQEPVPGQMSNTIYDMSLTQEPVSGQMPNTVYDLPRSQEPVPGQMSNTVYDMSLTQEPVSGQMPNTVYDLPRNQEPVPGQMSNTVYDLPLTQDSVQNRLLNHKSNLPYTIQQHLQQEPQQVSNTQTKSQQGNRPKEPSLQRNINSNSQFVGKPMSVKETQQISDQLRLTMPIVSGQNFALGQKRQMSQEAVDTQTQQQQGRSDLRQNQQLPEQAMGTVILQNPTQKFMNRDRQIPPQKAHGTQNSAAQAAESFKQKKPSLTQTLPNQTPLFMQHDQQYPSALPKDKQTSPTHASHRVQHEQQTLLQQMLGVEILPTESLMTLQQAHEYLKQNLLNDQTLPGTEVSQTSTKVKQHISNPDTFDVSSQKHQNPTQIFATQNRTNLASDFLSQNQEQFNQQNTNVVSKATQNSRLQDPSTMSQSSVPSKQIQLRQTSQQRIGNVEAKQSQINVPRHYQQFMEPNVNSELLLRRSSAAADQGGQRRKTELTKSQKSLRTTPVPSSFPHKSRTGPKSQPALTHSRLQPVHPKVNYQVKSEVKRNNPRSQAGLTSSSTTPQETPINLNQSKPPKRKLDNTNPRGIKHSPKRQSHSSTKEQARAQGIPLSLDRLLQTDLGQDSVQNHRRQERVTMEEQVKTEPSMTGRNLKRRKQNLTKNVVSSSVRYTTISPPSGNKNQPEFIQNDFKSPINTALQNPLKPLNVWNPSPDAPSGHPIATNWNVPKQRNRGRSRSSKNITSGRRNDTRAESSSSRSVKGGQYVKNWFNPRRFEDSNAGRNENKTYFHQSSNNKKSNAQRNVFKNVNENNPNKRLINSTPRSNGSPQKRLSTPRSNGSPQKRLSNQAGRSREIGRKNRKSAVNKHGRRKNPDGKSTQWEIKRGRSGRRPGNVERPADHPDSSRNNMLSSQNTHRPRTRQQRLNRGRNQPLRKRPVQDAFRPVERTPYTDSTTSAYATTPAQFNRQNRPAGKRPVKDTANVGKLPVKETIRRFENTAFTESTTSVYATTLSQFNRLGKHLFDSSGEVGQEGHTTVTPSVGLSSATGPSVKWNDWNQPPSNLSNFSSSKASSAPSNKFDFSLNTNKQDTKLLNETTITDTKRNKTITLKQTVRTLENASREGQPRAPVNFNVFLGIPTENPQGKASNTVDVLRLLNALSVLRGQLRPPTTILPPVKIVLQVEREMKPSKLRCRCFPKSDGCPSELKEEPLVDMCDVKVSIPCCEDG